MTLSGDHGNCAGAAAAPSATSDRRNAMRLLVAYDGSDGAKAAIDDLSHACLPEVADATVLSVIDGRAASRSEGRKSTHAPGNSSDIMELCNAVAQEGAERLQAHFPAWSISGEVCIGAPAWMTIERAEK